MGRIRYTHYQIAGHKGVPAGRVRIAVLADLHNRVYRSEISSLLAGIRREKCDAVLSAGDLVLMRNGHFETDQAVRLVSSLAKTLPVYVTNGNHENRMKRRFPEEYRRYEQALERSGVIRLHNGSADAVIHGMQLRITGLELDYRYFRNRYHKDLSVEEMRELIGACAQDRFQILLAHHPKYFPVYARWGADLTLAGHLHGGIARLPFLGGVISPDPELFPRYDYGLYEEGGSRMIVSAGLGTHTINLRFNNPAELVIADILAGD